MKKIAVALAVLALALPAQARKVSGVDFADTVEVLGQTLHLNGAGVRKKFIFEVYAGGLYLDAPSSDAEAIIRSDAPKRVRMVFLRDVSKKQVKDAYREGFENNSKGPGFSDLVKKLDELDPALRDMKNRDEMDLTFSKTGDTIVAVNGGPAVTVEGKEFAEALLRNWLGSKPADDGLKKAWLGK